MTLRPRIALLGLVLAAALACGGPTTRLTDVWSNPDIKGPLHFKKVLAVVLVPNPEVRKVAEGQLTVLMKQTQGVPSWMAVTEETARDREKLKAMLEREGFDGAVVVRLVSASQKVEWVSTSMAGFTGFWGYSYAATMTNGYLRTDTSVRVETRVFSLKDDRLVWAGYTKTVDPKSSEQTLIEVAQAVGEDMRSRGLIQ